ncbi:PAAR domain-containing protein [Pseudomonas silesiensis]|uniref:PAAR domain-containing protein n=1 Tax=Pseudomonas silesiensis TaxID=1853130 RepID=UPI0009EDCC79|nr:PAAR domain-containing protein [Pseudomonas silesiensis]
MTHPICLGDSTSSGGTVVSCQLSGTHRINGKIPAVLGDKATCPLHLGEFAFVEGHPRRRMNGIPVVLHGHRLACGCHGVSRHALNVRVT